MADEVEIQADNEGESEMGQKSASESDLQTPLQPNKHSEVKEEANTKTTSTSDDVSKQPTSQEDVYRQSKNRPSSKSPPQIHAQECLEKTHNDEDIFRFCQMYFPDVSRRLKGTDRLEYVAGQIADYCNRCGEMEYLWESIARERPNNYKEYYQQWQKAVENMGETDWLEQNRYEVVPDSSKNPIRPNPGDEPHPLATENSDAINKWFFDELNRQEQSFVLTVALFEGVNRKLLSELTREIESRLFDAV